MTGEGLVIKKYGHMADVRVRRESACGSDCASCGGCEDKSFIVSAKNCANANEGDRVKLYLPTGKVYLSATLVYLLPVLLLLAGAALFKLTSASKAIPATVLLFVIWFFTIRIYNKRADVKNVITEILQ